MLPRALLARLKALKMQLNWLFPHCCLAPTMLIVAYQTAGENCHEYCQLVLKHCTTLQTDQKRSITCAIVVGM